MRVEYSAALGTVAGLFGHGWRVPSYRGHVRDLPSNAGSQKPDEGFAMVYETVGQRVALGAVRAALGDAEGLAMIRLLMIEDDGAIAEMVVNYIIT